MAVLGETYTGVPTTERGRGILIAGDPKSDAIAYCSGRSVVIRSLDRPLEVSVYTEHAYPATVARFSPNGEWVASADASGAVRVWGRRPDHVLKGEFRVLSGRVDDLQWSPDGLRLVASGDGKGKAFVRAFMWDSGTSVGEFDGHSKRVLSCAFKPTRPFRIVTCGEDFLVNFYEGPPFKFKLSQRGHSNFVNCVRYAPDGSKFISVSSDKKGILYDGKTGDKIGELSAEDGHSGSIYAVSWSPDSKNVLTVSADKTAKLWEIADDGSGKHMKTFTCPGSGGLGDMLVGCLWHNDFLVVVSLDGVINVFSAKELDKAPISFAGHMKNVSSLTLLSQDSKSYIASSSYDGLILLWSPGVGYAGRIHRKDTSQIKNLYIIEEELVTSAFDNKVRRTPLNGGYCGDTVSVDIGTQPKGLQVVPQFPNRTLVLTESGVVMLQGSNITSTSNLGYSATACAVSPDGNEVWIGGENGKLHVYSVKGDILMEESVLEKHKGAITAICYSPNSSFVVTGDTNREAVVWDRVSKQVKLNNMLYHSARVNCLAWSPNSRLVATGSLDTCVILYDIDKPASSRVTIKGAHLGGVYGLTFYDDSRVVSSGEDACIRIWCIDKL